MDQNAAVSPDPPPQYFTNTYYGFGSDMLILIALFFAAVVAHFLSIAYNNRQHPVYTNEQVQSFKAYVTVFLFSYETPQWQLRSQLDVFSGLASY